MRAFPRATLISVTVTAATVPLWYLTAWYIGRSLPGIDIALALAAGVSFHLAYREKEAQAGMASASIAIAAILLIRIVSFNVTVPDGESSEVKLQRIQVRVLSAVRASERVPDENVDDYQEHGREWEIAQDAATAELVRLSPEELAEEWASYRAQQDASEDEIRYVTWYRGLYSEWTVSLSENTRADPSGLRSFFLEMYGPTDMFLTLIAFALAFVAGVGGLRHVKRLLGGVSPGEP